MRRPSFTEVRPIRRRHVSLVWLLVITGAVAFGVVFAVAGALELMRTW